MVVPAIEIAVVHDRDIATNGLLYYHQRAVGYFPAQRPTASFHIARVTSATPNTKIV